MSVIIFYNLFIYIATLQLDKSNCSKKYFKNIYISIYIKNNLFIKYEFVKITEICYLKVKGNEK